MKLKGENSKRLKPEQKKKMEETLKIMTATRKEDTKLLRDTLNSKLEALKDKFKKTQEGIQVRQQQIQRFNQEVIALTTQSERLKGGILTLNDVLVAKSETTKEE